MCVYIYMYICVHINIFPGDSDGKESACSVQDPGLLCIYMQKKKYHKQAKKTKNTGKWALDMPLNLPAVLPHGNQDLTCRRAL